MTVLGVLIGFLISLIISALIIYLATKLFGETEGFGTAILAALIGAAIYSFAYYFIAIGWVAALIGGIAWLITIGSLYKIGWLKSLLIAFIIWIFALITSLILPTVIGPL